MNQKIVTRRPGALNQIDLIEEAERVPLPGEAKTYILATVYAYGVILLRRDLSGGSFPVTPGYDLVKRAEALVGHLV